MFGPSSYLRTVVTGHLTEILRKSVKRQLDRLRETERFLQEPSGRLEIPPVLARFHTWRLLDVNQLLASWFPNAAAGKRVWFGGGVGYCTHSLLSQHTHSHLTHTPDTHTFSGIKWRLLPPMWISHRNHEPWLCWKVNPHVWPPPACVWAAFHHFCSLECGFRFGTPAGFLLLPQSTLEEARILQKF